MAERKFEVVGEETDPPPAQPQQQAAVSVVMLQLALKALSQRALTAATDLFTLITVASAFWLWWSISAPTDRQLISLSIYALFVLAANWLVRRK